MTTERVTLDADIESTFTADVASRRITGLAIPLGATANKGGRVWRFLRDSVTFGARTPLLAHHDVTRPVGRLTASRWSDRGLEVDFTVSRTSAGDEALQLANDGVLALSVGIDVPLNGARQVGDELHVRTALGAEVSLTPLPAFSGSVIDSVALSGDIPSERTTVDDVVTPTVTINLDAQALGAAIAQGMTPPVIDGPTPQPVPHAATFVSEEAPYRFDGIGGKFGFVADAVASSSGDGEATQRLNTFLRETFVTQANVTALNPVQNRPDMYVSPLRHQRPLAGLISTGTIASNTPFVLPRFNSAGTLVAPHVEGVEPTLGTYTATSQTITPGASSGKVELTREVWDSRGNPAVDQLVWQEMLAAADEAAEVRVATMLDGLSLTPIAINGVDSAVVDDITAELVALQFERGGNRYSSLALNGALYGALVAAKDGDGRKLLPILGATNANGTTDSSFGAVHVGNSTGVPVWGLSGNSYLMVPGSVFQWLSPPQRLTFDIQVKSVFIGLFQYSAEAVIRTSDVKRLTYSAV